MFVMYVSSDMYVMYATMYPLYNKYVMYPMYATYAFNVCNLCNALLYVRNACSGMECDGRDLI